MRGLNCSEPEVSQPGQKCVGTGGKLGSDADMQREQAYSVRKLAERWACSERLIYTVIGSGELRSFRPGNLIRISAAEVRTFEGGAEAQAEEEWLDDDV